jgi:hypothetical protein
MDVQDVAGRERAPVVEDDVQQEVEIEVEVKADQVEDSIPGLVAKQQGVLSRLDLARRAALDLPGGPDYEALKDIQAETAKERAYLERLEGVVRMRHDLRLLTVQSNWDACIELQTKIRLLEHGHRDWHVDGLMPCCGLAEATLPCRKIQVGDFVEIRNHALKGTKAIVTSATPGSKRLIVVSSGLQESCLTPDQVTPCEPPQRVHSGGYRMFEAERLLWLGSGEDLSIKTICGRAGGQDGDGYMCMHKYNPEPGQRFWSHWACCGQADLFSPCTQAFKYSAGALVVHRSQPNTLGVVTLVDMASPRLPYQVTWENEDTNWVADHALVDPSQEQREKFQALGTNTHTGQFRMREQVLFAREEAARALKFPCSLPANGEEDGMACAHKAESDKQVQVIPEPHWSCCGRGLFAPECKFKFDKSPALKVSGFRLGPNMSVGVFGDDDGFTELLWRALAAATRAHAE